MTAPRVFDRNEPLIVCFSQLRWDFVFQRPQHLMTKASQRHRILFFEEPVHHDGEQRLDLRQASPKITIAVPHLPHGVAEEEEEARQRVLLDRYLAENRGKSPLIFWYGTPMMLGFSDHIDAGLVVYDNMDELSAFWFAPRNLLAREEALLRRADVVFTGGFSIYEAKRHRHGNIHSMPSSIDKPHFHSARNGLPEPQDQAAIPHPRIGWFGVIDERMDPGLLRELAALRPGWQFIMVGPVVKIDPATLPKAPNTHWLGQKSYRDLPAYLSGWNAGFIPYAMNESTRFISPTKTPEFLAAGVPLVATPVRDIKRTYGDLGLVDIVETADEMAAALGRAMERPREPFLEKVDAFLADKSWDRTWDEMRRIMDATQARRAEPIGESEAA